MLIRLSFLLCLLKPCLGQELNLPRVEEPGWKIELVLAEPEIVTPTACCFDDDGRLLVVECHTHFPPDDYPGPKNDRIYALSDTSGDGKLNRKQTFYDGGIATMGLASLPDRWVAVVNRAEVTRLRDEDRDGVVDQREVLLRLKTKAEYPHNGLGGISLGPDGSLYVGLGENFGEEYELVAADGSKQVGSGEGGSIFRISTDGRNLERVATGFWNPFGICFDNAKRMWTVGNDPDAMPPCRLIHVVEGGDYGFQFRFGRGGRHPLQAWNGELPGTLPYAAGTGEAASAVLPVDDRLWVTSWGDNRIEAYKLTQHESTWRSKTAVVVQGLPDFRPVGLTRGPDGSVYFTDWVDRDYSVHQKGRVWRLRPTADRERAIRLPKLSKAELRRESLASDTTLTKLVNVLNDKDVFVHQAAMAALAKHPSLKTVEFSKLQTEQERAGVLAAWRWRELSQPDSVSPELRRKLITQTIALTDASTNLIALRWAAERKVEEVSPLIRAMTRVRSMTPKLLPTAVAASSYIENGTPRSGVRDPAREALLALVAGNGRLTDEVRAQAIRMLPSDSEQPTAAELQSLLLSSKNETLGIPIIRMLASRGAPLDSEVMGRVARNKNLPPEIRAEAVASLSLEQNRTQLISLARATENAIQLEATRVLRTGLDRTQHPDASDTDAWMKLVGSGGNPEAGRRVFWRMTCSRCHTHSGRGATTGPDLTSLHGQTRRRVLESILTPAKEVGPLYVPWNIVTTDGRALVGLKSTTSGVGKKLKFQNAEGVEFEVALEDIDSQTQSDQSIMPTGLEKTMSVAELRDLLAFLSDE